MDLISFAQKAALGAHTYQTVRTGLEETLQEHFDVLISVPDWIVNAIPNRYNENLTGQTDAFW
jgi:hypothetical protein